MGQCAATDGTHGPSSDGTSGGNPRSGLARHGPRQETDGIFLLAIRESARIAVVVRREESALRSFSSSSLFLRVSEKRSNLWLFPVQCRRDRLLFVFVSACRLKWAREREKDLVNNAWFLTPTGHTDNQTKSQRQKQRDNRAAPLGCNKYSRVASGRFFVDELFKSFARIGTIIQWGNYMDVEFHRVMETLIFKFVRPAIWRYFYHISLFSLLKQIIYQNFSREVT